MSDIRSAVYPDLYIADTFTKRLMGLFGKSTSRYDGAWIKPCNAVHTIGFSKPIDVYFLDKNNRVLKSVTSMKKNRIKACFGAKSVIEIYTHRARLTWAIGEIINV